MSLGKTAWVDRNVNAYWNALNALVPEEYLPTLDTLRRGMKSFEELGCGYYGCVLPTNDPGVVLKLTTDVTEARFANYAIQTASREIVRDQSFSEAEFWDGLVQYFGVYELVGATHRRRQVFAIWREEAQDIGFVGKYYGALDPYTSRTLREFSDNLFGFKSFAQIVWKYLGAGKQTAPGRREKLANLEDWAFRAWRDTEGEIRGLRGAERAAFALRYCEVIGELMENSYQSDAVGRALLFWMASGALLCDVHHNNVGMVTRTDGDYTYEQAVITDPGQCADLTGWSEDMFFLQVLPDK